MSAVPLVTLLKLRYISPLEVLSLASQIPSLSASPKLPPLQTPQSSTTASPLGVPLQSSHSSPELSKATHPQSLAQLSPLGSPLQSSQSSPELSAATQPQSLAQLVPFGTPAQSAQLVLSPKHTPHSSISLPAT